MTVEDYPEDIEIKKSNFKTDQQAEAAETIEAAWPTDLGTLADEGQHVKVFYSQVLDQFLGPADTEMTFREIESEYGSVSQWAESDGEPDVEETSQNGTGEAVDNAAPGPDGETATDSATTTGQSAAESAAAAVDLSEVDADIDDQRRAWFAAGFKEGVAFALANPELFDGD